ncbi:hypothetical protein [Synechococcus phage Ssp-JY39]|nr:hypothetical protein [Synechococcus phage Yong-M2-251]
MKIIVALSTDERLALRRFASETGEDMNAAAGVALREFLISAGFLEPERELDYDTETEGTA